MKLEELLSSFSFLDLSGVPLVAEKRFIIELFMA